MLQALRIQGEEDGQFSCLSELIFGVEWERSSKAVNQEKYQRRTGIEWYEKDSLGGHFSLGGRGRRL